MAVRPPTGVVSPSASSPCPKARPTSRTSHISSSVATCFMAKPRPTTPSRLSSFDHGSDCMVARGTDSQ